MSYIMEKLSIYCEIKVMLSNIQDILKSDKVVYYMKRYKTT